MLELKVVDLLGLQKKEDIVDWSEIAGNNKNKLIELVENTSQWTPTKGEVDQPKNKAKGFHWSDFGNTETFVDQHGTIIHYCYAWKKWTFWDGKKMVR